MTLKILLSLFPAPDYELTCRIRERYTSYELPVLLLTARGQSEDIVSGFLTGANTLVNLKGSINERIHIESALL